MLVAVVIAQRPGVVVEPFRSKPHPRAGWRRRGTGRGSSFWQSGAAPAQHRADASQKFAQLAGLCQVVVGAELKADHAIDRARGCREHDDRHAGAALEMTDDRKAVLFRHVEIEHDEVRHLLRDGVAQTGTAVAQADAEAVHAQIVPAHPARRLLALHYDDVPRLIHATGKHMWNLEP